jgi:hypothetical protein
MYKGMLGDSRSFPGERPMGEKVKVGHGWLDEHIPPAVQEVLDVLVRDHGRDFVISIQADEHTWKLIGVGDYTFFEGNTPADVAARLFQECNVFMKHLGENRSDITSLILTNFKPELFNAQLQPRPAPAVVEAKDFKEGLSLFLDLAMNSLKPQGSIWSKCEWAMLSVSKET